MALALDSISSFFVGGRTEIVDGREPFEIELVQQETPFLADPNGDFEVSQVYVQAYKQAYPLKPCSILLCHGGGLTGSVWESLADGRPGWLSLFLRAGYDVYVADGVGLGRSSWGPDLDSIPRQPIFRSKREAWELFRIGPRGSYSVAAEQRAPYPGSRFSSANFDDFAKRIVPRWLGTEKAAVAAYSELVTRVGDCVIVAHSSAAGLAYRAAARHPERVKGLCLLEPSLYPESVEIRDDLAPVPMLHMFGDFIDDDAYWTGLKSQVHQYASGGLESGIQTFLDLPSLGVRGNTHCLMADANAEVLVGMITQWIESGKGHGM
ncbi:alpha/beta fold hydrolase [Burkholderia cepacia]|uniref:alpha/beta fold hydrolase n=1 Tax=Burkholderia cepacia TaxID=292 RepID=UPI002AB6772B|nr:alpha/beta fold hydrolase [Burkholderia cepacia]